MAGVYYRPPDRGEPIAKAFLLQIQKASHAQPLVLLGVFSHPDICWKISTAGSRQSRRLLERIEDNFLSQVIDSPTRRDVLLDLLITNVSELIRRVKIGGSLGCSDYALVEFSVLRVIGQAKSKVQTLRLVPLLLRGPKPHPISCPRSSAPWSNRTHSGCTPSLDSHSPGTWHCHC